VVCVEKVLLINTLVLPHLVDKTISLSTRIPTIYECRCDERLKTETEESILLVYTGFLGELEHLQIETRVIHEMFPSVMGEYVFLK
jgi:hypothetical protein